MKGKRLYNLKGSGILVSEEMKQFYGCKSNKGNNLVFYYFIFVKRNERDPRNSNLIMLLNLITLD